MDEEIEKREKKDEDGIKKKGEEIVKVKMGWEIYKKEMRMRDWEKKVCIEKRIGLRKKRDEKIGKREREKGIEMLGKIEKRFNNWERKEERILDKNRKKLENKEKGKRRNIRRK